MEHVTYQKIIDAVESGSLCEPFGNEDFRRSCIGCGEGTYRAFLYKHKKGNKGGNSELFIQTSPNKFILIRPYKYGL